MRKPISLLIAGYLITCVYACGPTLVWYGHSPDRLHKVQLYDYRDKQYVQLNGQEGQLYDGIALDALKISPDSHRLAYPARKGIKWVVVLDGKESTAWDGIGDILFSPDSQHIVYAALQGSHWHVVRDEKVGPPFNALLQGSFIFSSDSNRFAYAAQHGRAALAVVDGKIGREYEGIAKLIFSSDNLHVAHVAYKDGNVRVVLDDYESDIFDDVSELVFNPGSHTLAYAVKQGEAWFVVSDGLAGKKYDAVKGITFSSNGKKMSFVARCGRHELVVCNKIEGRRYDSVRVSSLSFSLDEYHFAYVAQINKSYVFIFDGHAGTSFDWIDDPTLSTQGGKFGYIASRGNHSVVVLNGKVVGKYYWAGDIVFSPDGRKYGYICYQKDKMVVVHNGGKTVFDVVLSGSLIFSADSQHWACLVGDTKMRHIYLAVDGLAIERQFDWKELAAATTLEPAENLLDKKSVKIIRDWVEAEMKIFLSQR